MSHLKDYTIGIQHIKQLMSEISLGTKLVFAISGQITIKVSEQKFYLQEGDVLVLDRNTFYTIEGNEDNLLINLTISDTFFAHYYEDYFQHSFKFFSKESDPGRERVVGSLRKSVSELLIASATKKRANKLEAQSALVQILLLLTRFLKKEFHLLLGKKSMINGFRALFEKWKSGLMKPCRFVSLRKKSF